MALIGIRLAPAFQRMSQLPPFTATTLLPVATFNSTRVMDRPIASRGGTARIGGVLGATRSRPQPAETVWRHSQCKEVIFMRAASSGRLDISGPVAPISFALMDSTGNR